MSELDIDAMQRRLRAFAAERDWQRFHTPKNLVMALSVEAAELVELFQWRDSAEPLAVAADPEFAEAIADEVADIAIYLIRFADVVGIDVVAAIERKFAKNQIKYPPTISPA